MSVVSGSHGIVFRACVVSMMFGISLVTGCSCSSHGDDDVKIVQQQSYGQQLMDLDAARQKGLLTDKEYNKARGNILDKMKQ